MGLRQDKLINTLRSDPPCLDARDLAARIGEPLNWTQVNISNLLKEGKLLVADIPWRRALARGRPPGIPGRQSKLARKLEEIALSNDKDRVAAANTLLGIQSAGGHAYAPIEPEDREGIIMALSRQLSAGGREVSLEAFRRAWPTCDILLTEARNETAEAPAERSDAPASGGSLA